MNPEEKADLASKILAVTASLIMDRTNQKRISEARDIALMGDMSIPINDDIAKRIKLATGKEAQELVGSDLVTNRGGDLQLSITALFEAQPNVAVIDVNR